jgi:hypothetical protein
MPQAFTGVTLAVETGVVVIVVAAARDDDQERGGRLLLLGKGAVLTHRWARPLAAETDEHQ